jgi:hypothetical protein
MPLGGLFTALPSDSITERNTPRSVNVHFRFGEIRGRPGSGEAERAPVVEDILWIGQHDTVSGMVWRLMITETKIYRWGDATPGAPTGWFEITGAGFTNVRRPWTAHGEDQFFFTGGDQVFTWDGDDASGYVATVVNEDVANPNEIWGSTSLVRARFLEYFNDRLVVAYTIENLGSDLFDTFATKLRWTENGNYTKWDSTLGEGAGFLDLYEEGQGRTSGIRGLQDRLVIYKPHAIVEMVPTGTLSPVHVSQTRSRGIGCSAPYTIASNGFVHFFLGTDGNVYAWNGVQLNPIGDPIVEELRSLYDPAAELNYFGVVVITRDEYWLVFDSDNVYVYDYRRNTWTRDTFPNITALAEVDDTIGTTIWSAVAGNWSQQGTNTWEAYRGTRRTQMVAGRSTGETYIIDERFIDDYFAIGCIIDKVCETPDMYIPSQGDSNPWQLANVKRCLLMYRFINAEPFEIGLSVDRGSTWVTETVVPDESGYSVVDFNVTGNVVRFRFRENNATGAFRWRQFAYEFLDAGPFRP